MRRKIFFHMDVTIEPIRMPEADIDREKAQHPKDHIPGWGHDADPENDPTYPIKNWTGADYQRFNYDKPEQQPVTVEVLHSNERPGISRVFGTSVPPKGLSGGIRRFAFRYSESSYGHWVPLVLADRIDVFRGIIHDIRKGIFPNIFAEKGWKADWKYNRAGLIRKVAIQLAVATLVIVMLTRKKKSLSIG